MLYESRYLIFGLWRNKKPEEREVPPVIALVSPNLLVLRCF